MRHYMKMKNFLFWTRLLLLVFSAALTSFAQSDSARLQGTVTDPQGAAVNGATVAVTSVDTDRLSTVTTSELGYYSVSGLPPGNYGVDIPQKGFKKSSRDLTL